MEDHQGRAGSAIVEVRHARIGYLAGNEPVLAVADVSFEIQRGERVMLLGPSGCGKSTLLKAVAGFNKLISGELIVDGRSSPGPGPDRAIVFQEMDQLFPWRTVLGNVAYPLRRLGAARADAEATAHHYLDMMGLADASDRHPHQLSGGMKQRVAIARAFSLQPSLLLMDEPFGALDAQTRARLQEELLLLAQSTAASILFVTHSIEEALRLGDRVVVLGEPPSTVIADIDLTDADLSEPGSHAEMYERMRRLLGMANGKAERTAV